MTALIIEAILWGLAVGILGATYREILAKEETFTKWWQFGARYENRWFFKPVWGCGHCFAGQFSLWTWMAFKILAPVVKVWGLPGRFWPRWQHYTFQGMASVLGLILAVGVSIFVAKVLIFILQKNKV